MLGRRLAALCSPEYVARCAGTKPSISAHYLPFHIVPRNTRATRLCCFVLVIRGLWQPQSISEKPMTSFAAMSLDAAEEKLRHAKESGDLKDVYAAIAQLIDVCRRLERELEKHRPQSI
jgi:hypothetical protein